MRIVVNHVTRMSAPRICVAGIDPETFHHVRPTTPHTDLITRDLLRGEGGPFGMGAVVDLGDAVPEPSPPETEDHRFRTADARHVEDMSDDEFLQLLDEMSAPDLASAFGPALESVGWKYAVDAGCGERSLAVVRPSERPILAVDDTFGKLQLQFNDPDRPTYLPVTDVRFYEEDQATIRTCVVENVAARLRRGVDALLMMGLPHAYHAPNDDRARHWLQLNGVCLTDNPVDDVP
ncbi:MAG TPA: hypothetical protein VG366_03800 [Solirubrobacteraceae bacterium]|nr:hypothetical protein [Solirubrobacteraceae bacterium]